MSGNDIETNCDSESKHIYQSNHEHIITDMFGDAGKVHVLERYGSNRTFLGVIFGFYITAFVSLMIFVSSKGDVTDYGFAYCGLILFVIIMCIASAIMVGELFRYDHMWPIESDSYDVGVQIGVFISRVKKQELQLRRIIVCQKLEFIEAMLISSFISSMGLVAMDFMDPVIGLIMVIMSLIPWSIVLFLGFRLLMLYMMIHNPSKEVHSVN